MDEQISFGISGTVNVDGKKSIDDVSKSIETSITKLEKMEKTAKSVTEALAKMFKGVSTQNLNSKEQTEINNFAQRYRRREYENSYSQYRQRQNQSFGFTPITDQVSQRRFSPMYDENYALHQRNQMSALSLVRSGTKNVSRVNASYFAVEDRLAKKTQDIIKDLSKQTEELIFENKAGISRAELSKIGKEFDDYEKKLSAMVSEHDKSFLEARIKGTDTLYQKNAKQSYYQNQHQQRYDKWRQRQESIHGSQWYTTETGFTMGPNNAPYGEGQQIAERIHQAQKERAEAEQRIAEQAREHLRQTTEQSRLLLTADAGIKKLKDENLNSEEDIVHEKEQQVEAEKKNTAKSKQMTEYQSNKIRVEDEHNKIRADRAATEAAAEARKKARDNSGYNEYRNAHPELFAVGALYHSKRYQTGHAFQSLGGVASTLGSGGRAVGLALDSLGAFFKAVPLGIATTVSNLAKGVTELGKAAVQAYAEIESIKTQLGVVFSNQTQADAMFGQISQYAVKSPFGVQQTSELAVLLKQSGVYASDLMNTLKMLGDTAGGNMEKMKRIANNYAQIVSIGKASMLDMRQFAYAGIPIFEAVSKELGVSQQELRKLISDGKVTADIVEKVFKDLTGINGIFENATEKGAQTLKARLQNLSDAKQLALGALGERAVNAGTQYGNDGFMLKFVSTAESFFNWMKEHNDIRNIERDVNTIATSDKRITDLQAMLQYAKDTGDENAVKMIEAAIKAQRTLFDPDKIRSILSESYDQKTSNLTQLQSQYGFMTEEEARAAKAQYELRKIEAINSQPAFASQEEIDRIDTQIAMWQKLSDDMDSYIAAIQKATTVTEEETKAHREVVLINKQQSAFDQAQKEAGKEGSYSAAFDKLYSLETQSEEYKKKKQDEEIKFLKDAQEALRKLADFVDEQGNLDMTKLGYGEFSALYNDKHAFDPSKKLTITEGKSEAQMTSDRAILEKQWNDMSDKIAKELSEKGQDLAVNRMGVARRMYSMEGGDNKTYFANFDLLLNHQLSILEELAKENAGTDDEKYYQDMYNNLLASTFQLGVNKKGLNANPDDLLQGAKNDFIPLWKRILAQYTGLSTLEMTSTADTMKRYHEDMAVRNMTSNVMAATMKSMSVDTAMRLVSAGGAKQLKEDSAGTLQVDWQQTQENIKKFSLALSASTEVVSAYKKSLEDELEVYQQLIVAGYTQGENQNGGESQFISVKKLAQYAQSNEQLVNAFGDTLETASGKKYSVDDLRFTQEGIFDKFGNKIDDQVKVTSNLSRFIESILPKMYDDLHEANVSELNNSTIKQLFDNISSTTLLSKYISSGKALESAQFINANPEYARSYIDTALSKVKIGNPFLQGMGNTDILLKAYDYNNGKYEDNKKKVEQLTANGQKKEAKKLADENQKLLASSIALDEIFKWLGKDIESLTGSDAYKNLFELNKTKEKTDTVNAEILALTALSNNLKSGNQAVTAEGNVITSATALKPEDYRGTRGTRNRILKYGFGLSRDYDLDDLYIQAAKTENLAGQEKNQFGINADKFKGLENEDEILKALSAREKAWIRITKAQEDSLQVLNEYSNEMLHTFAEVGKGTWEKPFEKMGENLVLGKEASEGMDDVFKNLTAELLTASGQAMVKAGWELVARGAADRNYAMIAGGLALAGAGAFTAGMGNAVTQEDKETKEAEDKARRLEALRNNLADLLKQAREDAIYYENTLRHKKALSANDSFTTRSVHDAIITPRGDVVTTDPKDYLIATKTPKTLVGGGAPTINFNVIDKSTGIRVTQQKSTYNQETNSIDFEAIIESKVTEVIASSKGDDAFNAREARLRGRSVIA